MGASRVASRQSAPHTQPRPVHLRCACSAQTKKTGSSTISNLLHNYVARHTLTVAQIPPSRAGHTWFTRSTWIDHVIMRNRNPCPAHVWANHVVISADTGWEGSRVVDQTPPGCAPGQRRAACPQGDFGMLQLDLAPRGRFLTIVREPTMRFGSHTHAFHGTCDIDEWVRAAHGRVLGDPMNDMCHQLGLPRTETDEAAIERRLRGWDVLVMERMEESLLLFRDRHGLKPADIVVFPQKTTAGVPCPGAHRSWWERMSQPLQRRFAELRPCEFALYRVATRRLDADLRRLARGTSTDRGGDGGGGGGGGSDGGDGDRRDGRLRGGRSALNVTDALQRQASYGRRVRSACSTYIAAATVAGGRAEAASLLAGLGLGLGPWGGEYCESALLDNTEWVAQMQGNYKAT